MKNILDSWYDLCEEIAEGKHRRNIRRFSHKCVDTTIAAFDILLVAILYTKLYVPFKEAQPIKICSMGEALYIYCF